MTDTLPDGSMPGDWMPGDWAHPPHYRRTYHVDQKSPSASDSGDGSSTTPFRTINRAAEVVQPGERVLVASGIYREQVQPFRGGTGPDDMVTFEGEAGQTTVIRGSCVLPPDWRRASPRSRGGDVWTLRLPEAEFADNNPFAQVNLDKSDPTNWQSANPEPVCPADILRRGLIFQDGRRLEQVGTIDDLAGTSSGYCVGDDGWTIHLTPAGGADPNSVLMEATNRAQGFAPTHPDVNYLRLTRFAVEQVGNGFAYPVEAAISPMGGHHWIIDNNIVRHVNADGVNIGNFVWTWGGNRSAPISFDCIVRANVIADCGVSGIKGQTLIDCLIEDNTLDDIGWQSVERGYDNGGMKLLVCSNTLIRRNVIRRAVDAPGIWLDWDIVNCRATNNLFVDTLYPGGAIFVEASEEPNWVDHNVIWNTKGNGVYLQDCDGVHIFDNIIGGSTGAAVDGRVCTERQLHGRPVTCRNNHVRSNIFVDNKLDVSFTDPDNTVEDNVVLEGLAVPNQAF